MKSAEKCKFFCKNLFDFKLSFCSNFFFVLISWMIWIGEESMSNISLPGLFWDLSDMLYYMLTRNPYLLIQDPTLLIRKRHKVREAWLHYPKLWKMFGLWDPGFICIGLSVSLCLIGKMKENCICFYSNLTKDQNSFFSCYSLNTCVFLKR